MSNGEKKNVKKSLVVKKFDLITNESKKLIEDIITRFQKGVDYDVVVKGKKPTLLIPGADKLCNQFSLRPMWRRDTETMAMLTEIKNCVAYICELVDRKSGLVIGEGRGAAIVDEAQNCKTVNGTIKMAEIRAKRDAVLNLFPIRDRFTQDIEGFETEKRAFTVSDDGKVRTKVVETEKKEEII